MYLQQGSVKLSVLSSAGKEAIVGVLQPGDFFREGCLAGQQAHIAAAVGATLVRGTFRIDTATSYLSEPRV
jgi:CRP/FNR family cyclic AMP-dependent transcriptional regulator